MEPYRSRTRRLLCLEPLEGRRLLAAAPMTPVEHHVHELVNLVRGNPAAAAAHYRLDLNIGLGNGTISDTPKQPIRRTELLRDVVEQHLQDMLQNNFFSHTGSDGSSFISRIEAAGLTEWQDLGENLAWGGNQSGLGDHFAIADQLVAGLFASPSHRATLFNEQLKEGGTSFQTGLFEQGGTTYHAAFTGQDYAVREPSGSFLTGMACSAKHERFGICDVQQPLAAATLRLSGPNGEQLAIQTGVNGEFDLELADGVWRLELEAEGHGPFDPVEVTIGPQNAHVSFMPPPNEVWHNAVNGFDVNGDSEVTSIDALIVVNSLNADGPRYLPQDVAFLPAFLDTNADNYLAPGDALSVINVLNQAADEGESVLVGEGESAEAGHEAALIACPTCVFIEEPGSSGLVPCEANETTEETAVAVTAPALPLAVSPAAKKSDRSSHQSDADSEHALALLEYLAFESAPLPWE